MICRQWLGWMAMLLLVVIILDFIFTYGWMKCMIQMEKVLVHSPSLTRRKT